MSTIAITNGVTGNVGSCKVEKTSVYVSTFKTKDITTNSCTGEVTTYPEHFSGDIMLGGFLISMIILGCVFLGMVFHY